jgi:hypothetical protein
MEEPKNSVWSILISIVSCRCVEREQTDTELLLTKGNDTDRSGNKSVSKLIVDKDTECYA